MRQISIEIIQKCPNNCLYCSSFSNKDSKYKICTEKVKEVINSAKCLDTQVISISGGEPFKHEGLLEIVKYAKEKGIEVYIYTSGIIDNKGQISSLDEGLLRNLHEVKVDKLIFNLPAIDEKIYNKIMNTKGHQKFVLESIKKSKETEIFTELHFVPNRLNICDIEGVLKFASATRIDKVSFIRLVLHGRALENKDKLMLSDEQEEALKDKLHDLVSDKVRVGIPLQLDKEEGCYAVRDKLCIRYDGRVFGCETFKYINLCNDKRDIVLPDSIYDRRLDEIYFDSKHLKLEKEFIRKQLEICNCNEKCPVQRKFKREY